MVLSIIFLEDKHKMLLHLSILYEYQQFFQHCICFSIQPSDYSDPWPRLAHPSSFFLIRLFNKQYSVPCVSQIKENIIGKCSSIKYQLVQIIFVEWKEDEKCNYSHVQSQYSAIFHSFSYYCCQRREDIIAHLIPIYLEITFI